MKIKINGHDVEGDALEIAELLELVNGGDVYISESKGPTLVADMNISWVRNALLLIYSKWLTVMRSADDDEFLELLKKGPVGYDQFDSLLRGLIEKL